MSGLQITPTWETIVSPRERDMAKPGPIPFRTQTLIVSEVPLFTSTTPPHLSILYRSILSSGLWSWESGITVQLNGGLLPV